MTLQDRWRRAFKGRAWLEVRRGGVVQRRTALTDNVVTDLGLVFLFWALWQDQVLVGGSGGPSPDGFLATVSYNGYSGYQALNSVGGNTYYDGTYYHAAWANPLTLLYASTDATTPSETTNVLPGGTLIALGAARNQIPGTKAVTYEPPSGQSVSNNSSWSFDAIVGTSPSIGQQTTTSTLVTIPFVPYAGSGTITVGSVGFTNGLYASTSSTTAWTTIDGNAMSLTGSSSPASTTNLSIGTKLIPSTTLSVTHGEQLVVNYEISFTPA